MYSFEWLLIKTITLRCIVAINEAFHAEEEIMLHISPDSPATTNVESHDGTAFSKPNSSTLSKSVSFESNNQGNSVDPAVRVSDFLT